MKRTLFFLSVGFLLPLWGGAQIIVNGGLTQRLDLQPGSSTTVALELKNIENKVNRVRFELLDYHIDCDKGYLYDAPGTEEKSLANWLTLDHEELILAPFESRHLTVSVQVPPGYAHSSAHACVMINNEPILEDDVPVATIGVKVRYAVNFLYTNPEVPRKTDLFANELFIKPLGENAQQLRISYTNLGNTTTSFTTKAELLSEEGELVFTYEAPKQTIQPTQCRTIAVPVENLPPGHYELILFSRTETGEMFGVTESISLP